MFIIKGNYDNGLFVLDKIILNKKNTECVLSNFQKVFVSLTSLYIPVKLIFKKKTEIPGNFCYRSISLQSLYVEILFRPNYLKQII